MQAVVRKSRIYTVINVNGQDERNDSRNVHVYVQIIRTDNYKLVIVKVFLVIIQAGASLGSIRLFAYNGLREVVHVDLAAFEEGNNYLI